MTLEEFEAQYPGVLSPVSRALCERGIVFMERNKDGIHNPAHVFSLLGRLHAFRQNAKNEYPEVNLEVMALAICWHDTWRAGRTPGSALALLLESWWDAWGSFFLFLRESRRAGISPAIRRKTAYAIRMHAGLRVFSRSTQEARLLYDIDILDSFSYERARLALERFLFRSRVNRRTIRFAAHFLRWWLHTTTQKSLYTDWAHERFRVISPPFIGAAQAFLKKYRDLLTGKMERKNRKRDQN